MDAKVRNNLKRVMDDYPEGRREKETFPDQGLRLLNEGERAYSRALRMVQNIEGGIDNAVGVEHYYAPVPGDDLEWCVVCGCPSTYYRHRGSSSGAKDFLIGAYELYVQLMRYYGVKGRVERENIEKLRADLKRVTAQGNATEDELELDCQA